MQNVRISMSIQGEDNTPSNISVSGVDLGESASKPLVLVRLTPKVLVIKAPSGSHWAGIGMTSTHGTTLYVFTYERRTFEGGRLTFYGCNEVTDIPIRGMVASIHESYLGSE